MLKRDIHFTIEINGYIHFTIKKKKKPEHKKHKKKNAKKKNTNKSHVSCCLESPYKVISAKKITNYIL